jgi:hypothetical protein
LNVDFNERTFIGDNPKVLEKYNNNVSNNKSRIQAYSRSCHKVSGIIAANRKNNKGIKGLLKM